jgi:hypothetical protein
LSAGLVAPKWRILAGDDENRRRRPVSWCMQ